MDTPALSGSRSVRSCEPPSGKMPRQPPSFICSYTLPYMSVCSDVVSSCCNGRREATDLIDIRQNLVVHARLLVPAFELLALFDQGFTGLARERLLDLDLIVADDLDDFSGHEAQAFREHELLLRFQIGSERGPDAPHDSGVGGVAR